MGLDSKMLGKCDVTGNVHIHLVGLCYFLFTTVLCFAQEHWPNWSGMGMNIVVCPFLS